LQVRSSFMRIDIVYVRKYFQYNLYCKSKQPQQISPFSLSIEIHVQ
jgi:hypothetical protein